MIKVNCNNVIGIYNHCSSVIKVYTYGSLCWVAGSWYYYISWMPSSASGTFTIEGVTRNLSNYSGYFSGFSGIITESAFISNTTIRSIDTNANGIDNSAFYSCYNLSYLNASKCKYIGSSAFEAYNPLGSKFGNIRGISLPKCKSIYEYAFHGQLQIRTSLYFPECEYIGSHAFEYAFFPDYSEYEPSRNATVNLPKCSYIGSYAFKSAAISSISLPVCEYIGSYAFSGGLGDVGTVYLPKCKYIGSNAFINNNGLRYINAPECSYVGDNAFIACYLNTVSLPECEYIGEWAFNDAGFANYYYNYLLDLPKCSYIGSYAFYGSPGPVYNGTNLFRRVNLPVCKYISAGAFRNCYRMSSISLPECEYIGPWAFESCSSLTSIVLPNCSSFGNGVFYMCTSLSTITLEFHSVCNVYSSEYEVRSRFFGGTLITSTSGSIYVPQSLVRTYKEATFWSYYSDIIYPIC